MAENKLVREDVLAKENLEEIGQILEGDVVTFSETLSAMDADALKKAEEDLMEDFKENEAYLKDVKYDLSDEVEFEDRKIKRTDLAAKIIQFLNRIEVQFQTSLGMYQSIRFWKTTGNVPGTPIPYGAFDSTLRMLGTLKFKGEQDCFDILVVNNWFTTGHKAYSRDNIWTQYLAAKHQAIMSAMEDLEKSAAEAANTASPDTAV